MGTKTSIILVCLFLIAPSGHAEIFRWLRGRNQPNHNQNQNQNPQAQNQNQNFNGPAQPPQGPRPTVNPVPNPQGGYGPQSLLSQINFDLMKANESPVEPAYSIIHTSCLTDGDVSTKHDLTFIFHRSSNPRGESVAMKVFPGNVEPTTPAMLGQLMSYETANVWQDTHIPSWSSAQQVSYRNDPGKVYDFTLTTFSGSFQNGKKVSGEPWVNILIGTNDTRNQRANRTLTQCSGPVRDPGPVEEGQEEGEE